MSTGRILIVDDEPQIRRVMRTTLTSRGYEVGDARSGEEALEKLRLEHYDLILLDFNMPGMNGLEACRSIRDGSDVPIIMVTVRNTERDLVETLDAGASDYVTKPFSIGELLARIRAHLRSRVGSGPEWIKLDGVEIDFETRRATVSGQEVSLTPKQFELMRFLANHPNRVISHREILRAVWGPDYGNESGLLRALIKQLRKKIEAEPSNPKLIVTEPWVGYRLVLNNQPASNTSKCSSPTASSNLLGFAGKSQSSSPSN